MFRNRKEMKIVQMESCGSVSSRERVMKLHELVVMSIQGALNGYGRGEVLLAKIGSPENL
jgi:hypothetical protein